MIRSKTLLLQFSKTQTICSQAAAFQKLVEQISADYLLDISSSKGLNWLGYIILSSDSQQLWVAIKECAMEMITSLPHSIRHPISSRLANFIKCHVHAWIDYELPPITSQHYQGRARGVHIPVTRLVY